MVVDNFVNKEFNANLMRKNGILAHWPKAKLGSRSINIKN